MGGGGERQTQRKIIKHQKAPKTTKSADDPGGGERGKHRKLLKLYLD